MSCSLPPAVVLGGRKHWACLNPTHMEGSRTRLLILPDYYGTVCFRRIQTIQADNYPSICSCPAGCNLGLTSLALLFMRVVSPKGSPRSKLHGSPNSSLAVDTQMIFLQYIWILVPIDIRQKSMKMFNQNEVCGGVNNGFSRLITHCHCLERSRPVFENFGR